MVLKRFTYFKNAILLSNDWCRSHQRWSPSSFLTILFSKLVGEFLEASKFSKLFNPMARGINENQEMD